MEAMNTGLFTYFAHPDLIHYNGDRKFYMDALRPVCAEAKSCGIPLEINLLGIREGRHYPNRSFWEVAAEAGCDVILGCDAHSPQGLNDPKAEREGLALAKEFGLWRHLCHFKVYCFQKFNNFCCTFLGIARKFLHVFSQLIETCFCIFNRDNSGNGSLIQHRHWKCCCCKQVH